MALLFALYAALLVSAVPAFLLDWRMDATQADTASADSIRHHDYNP